MMSEHPVFVPYGDEVLAGIVTVPEGTPRGVVLWLQGQGASSRAHKYRLWVRGAHKLAERGIGTLRMDLPGMGESTGSGPKNVEDLPTAEAAAMLDFAQRALGVDAFALAGHCYGAQAVFDLAEDPRCRGVGFILFADPRYIVAQPQEIGAAPPVAAVPAAKGGSGQPAWKRAVRKAPGMKGVLRYRRKRIARARPWPQEFVRLVGQTSTLFLLLRPERRAKEIRLAIDDLGRRVPGAQIDITSIDHSAALTRMPRAIQEWTLDQMVDWFDKVMPAPGEAARPTPPVSAVVGAE
jgi:pimeloyl-ACP methyl ester carboxylesterase